MPKNNYTTMIKEQSSDSEPTEIKVNILSEGGQSSEEPSNQVFIKDLVPLEWVGEKGQPPFGNEQQENRIFGGKLGRVGYPLRH